MAIYHCSIKIISRGKGGKSAVGAAAYRSGEKIKNEYDGETHDYTKKGGVIHTEILLPDHAPREYADRSVLWNAVEKIENAKNSQLAREIELALPVELSIEQNIFLAREYVKKHFVSAGMCADICIHDMGTGNPHAHIMLTLRSIELDGRWGAKSKKEYILDDNGEKIRLPSGEYKSRKVNAVDWNEKSKAEEWRSGWANAVNKVLSEHGVKERIDHRSYERQGIDTIPTVHMGVAASQMEKKGIKTDRGDINRRAEVSNNNLRQLKARIRKAKESLYAIPIQNAPSFISIMEGISKGKNLETNWQKIRDLQTRARVFNFLMSNNITDMTQLVEKVTKINENYLDVSDKLKKVDRRLETLTNHFTQYDIYKQHKSVYDQYRQLDPKKRDTFYDKHGDEIQAYKDAKAYLDAVRGEHKSLPIKDWQSEQKRLTAARFTLCEKFYGLQDEIKSVETVIRGADNIMRDDMSRTHPIRTQSAEK